MDIGNLFNLFLLQPLINGLILFLNLTGNHLGFSIIGLTVAIRVLLIPLTIPSMKAQKKMSELAPEISELKKKYGTDKQGFARAQMELYKKHGANPAAGCLPTIVQFAILIALYQAFIQVLQSDNGQVIMKLNELAYPFLKLAESTKLIINFTYLNLAKPDTFNWSGVPVPGLFLILAAITQFLSSKMMAPIVKKEEKVAAKTEEKTDDMMVAMQGQMLYLFPAMTIFIGFTFPSGLVLYWFIFSVFQLVQQYFVSGWGGLSPWIAKIKRL